MFTASQKLVAGVALLAALAFLAWVGYTTWERGNSLLQASQTGNSSAVNDDSLRGGETDYNVNTIVSAHLFGVKQVQQKVVEQPKVVPKTNLRLRLVGLLASDAEGGIDRALIALESGPAKSYKVGDAIERTDSKLHAVEPGRVLLDRNGRIETLELNRQVLPSGANNRPTARGGNQLGALGVQQQLGQVRRNNFQAAGNPQPVTNLPTRIRPLNN